MPAWYGTPPVPTLSATPGDLPVVLFNNEAVVANEASQAAALFQAQGAAVGTINFGVYLQFSAAPGAISILVQAADKNVDADFVTIDTITSVDAVNFNFRKDYANVNAKLVRFKVVTFANLGAVTIYGAVIR